MQTIVQCLLYSIAFAMMTEIASISLNFPCSDTTRNVRSKNGHSNTPEQQFSIRDQNVPLKVMCEINGHSIPAIIDTGAQISVMSLACARRCQLGRQIDSRANYCGRAIGIGSCDIVGRIDSLAMRIGPVSFNSHISILRESGADLLIGLDFLRRFGGEINLRNNEIRLKIRDRTVRVPFLNDNCNELMDLGHDDGYDAEYDPDVNSYYDGRNNVHSRRNGCSKTKNSQWAHNSYENDYSEDDSDESFYLDGMSMEGV